MANELLDFVLSLVRDPQVAAQYAADPAQAIANAHLTDVTSADVSNLIPMVSDSFASFPGSAPGFGSAAATDGNVWTSGAATAAFDAFTPDFTDHAATAARDLFGGLPGNVIDTQSFTPADATQLVSDAAGGNAVAGLDDFDPSAQLHDLGVDPTVIDATAFDIDHGVFDQLGGTDVQHHLDVDSSGFDLLN